MTHISISTFVHLSLFVTLFQTLGYLKIQACDVLEFREKHEHLEHIRH